MIESEFQKHFIQTLDTLMANKHHIFLQFIKPENRSYPDRIILGPNTWAAIEFKRRKDSKKQPLQTYHVQVLNEMSLAFFVYPGNEQESLDAIESLFTS